MNCPNCNKERDFNENQCECGFVFAPGCLMPIILFSAIHVAGCYSLIISDKEVFPFSKEAGIFGTALFAIITVCFFKRMLWSIYALRSTFIFLIVLQIMAVVKFGVFPELNQLVFPVMQAAVAIYLMRPELVNYFKIKNK